MPTRAPGRHRAAASSPAPAHTTGERRGRARPVVKAGALVVACSGMVATVGLQPSAASPGSRPSGRTTALGLVPASEPAARLTAQPAAVPAPVADTGRTSVAAEGPTLTAQPLLIGSRVQLIARGQLGQLGFVGVTAVVPVVGTPARPAQRTSRSTTRDDRADASDGTARDATSSDSPDSPAGAGKRSRGDASSDRASSDRASSDRASSDRAGSRRTRSSDDDSSSGPTGDAGQPPTDAESTAGDGPGSASFGAGVMAIASRYEGTPYRFGGTTPAGFDCSGFTSYVMARLGYDLPRTSGAQRGATRRIPRSEAVAGDLVFMPGHVGIYAGNGMMIDSPRSGLSVSLRAVYSSSATYGRVG